MITIIYRPIRFETKKEQIFSFSYDSKKSLREYIKETGIDYKDTDIILEGETIKDLSITLKENQQIIITPSIEWDVLVAVGAFVWWAFVETAWGWLTVSLLSAGYSIYASYAAKKNMPSFGGIGDGLDESSPTYGFDGIQTTQEVGCPVKLVYGEHRTGGNIINQYIQNEGDRQYLNILIGIGEGEIESVSDILINDMPSDNFEGISIETKMGTSTQGVISNFADLHNLYSIGVALVKDDPYTYTTIDSDIEAFEINFVLPAGLFAVDKATGNINSWAVTYKVEYKLNEDEEYIDLGETTINAYSRTALRRTFRKSGLTAGKYDIRITRTSDDTSLDPQLVGDLQLSSIDEIKTDDLAYPYTALLSIKALATDQLSGSTPNITFVVKGIKTRLPEILTEEEGEEVDWEDYYWDDIDEKWRLFSDDSELYWDGITYINKWNANPIWAMRDMQTNTRYGLGEFILSADLDEDELLEQAKHCETKVANGLGGFEKRFRLDVAIDSACKAPDIISQLSASFRAFPLYSNNGFSFRIDKPQDAVQVFGMGNIVKSNFSQSWKSKTEVYNLIEIQMNDKETDYTSETVSVMDEESLTAGDPIKKKDIRLFTTEKSYAIREARYALKVSKYINQSLNLRCGIDAIACKPGDRVEVSHDLPQWGFSGRVLSGSTTTTIKVDREITIESGKTYKLMIRFDNDTIEEQTITNTIGNYSELTVESAFSAAPQEYDVFVFGESSIVTKPFRVLSIAREHDGECNLSLIEYNEDVYDDTAIEIPTNNYSALNYEIPNVTDLKLTERLTKLADGKIENVIDVWFNKPSLLGYAVRRYMKAKIYLSDDDGESWVLRGETSSSEFNIVGGLIDNLTYTIAVVSVGDNSDENAKSISPQLTLKLLGKTVAPSDVEYFFVNQSRDRLYLGWTHIDDVDLDSYEIRYGDSWEAGYTIASRLKSNRHIILDFKIGDNQKFFIKAIDTTGNYSATAAEAVITIANIPFTNIIKSFEEHDTWTGDKVDTEVDEGTLILSSGKLTGTYTTAVNDLDYIATFKIGIETVISSADDATWQDFGELTFGDMPTDYRFSGTDIPDAVSYKIKTSDDNSTWSDWTDWQPADYTCRYFQLEMTLTRQNTSQELVCAEFGYYADLPDVDDKLEDEVTVAADGVDVVFSKEFHKIYGIHVTITSGDGVYYKISSLDLTGCNIKLYNESAVAKTGDILVHVHGV